jgi:hypothetical protein
MGSYLGKAFLLDFYTLDKRGSTKRKVIEEQIHGGQAKLQDDPRYLEESTMLEVKYNILKNKCQRG